MMDAPFQGFSPELLAKIAQGAFRPPQVMGMQAPSVPQTPGFNMSDGMQGLGMGLGAFARNDAFDGRTTSEGNISGFPTGGGPKGPSGGALAPPPPLDPTNPSHVPLGPGAAKPPGGMLDFLTNMFSPSTGAGATPGGAGAGGTYGAGGGGSLTSGASAVAVPAAIAAAIGFGKNTEANHANTPFGDALLAGLGPDINQVVADPIGMGLPTLLGVPFITPFTAKKEAKAAKPEWSSFFPIGV